MDYAKGKFCIVPNLHMIKFMSDTASKVYIAICKHANDDGECFPSRKAIKEFTGVKTLKTISKCTEELVQLGVIEKKHRLTKSGSPTSNLYQIKEVGYEMGGRVNDDPRVGASNDPRWGNETTLGRGVKRPTNYTTELNQLTKPINYTYGELEKVKLSKDEYSKLCERFGYENTTSLIEELDTYIASKGKKYKSHYATLINWAKRKYNESKSRQKQITFIDASI